MCRGIVFGLLAALNFGSNVACGDQVDDAVRKTAIELSKQTPLRVDEKTTLLAVVAAGKVLKYSFRVDYQKTELPNSWNRTQETILSENVCSHSAMRNMMKYGVKYSYLYLDRNGHLIADIGITEKQCR